MKKVLLFLFAFSCRYVIAQQTANKSVAACSFVPAFTINNTNQCLSGNSFTFTNSTPLTNTRNLNVAWAYSSAAAPATITVSGTAPLTADNQTVGGSSTTMTIGSSRRLVTNNSSNWPTSLDANNFVEFSIAAKADSTITINTISYKGHYDAGSGAVLTFETRYAINAGSYTTVGTNAMTNSQATYTLNLATPLTISNLDVLKIRLYIYAASAGSSRRANIDDVTLSGFSTTAALTYDWDFGDATTHSSAINPTHVYTASGSYPVKLTATSATCSDNITQIVGVLGNVVYVNANAIGNNNGTSWSNAFTALQPAINAAAGCGSEVWVAAGTYKPTLNPSTGTSAGSNRDYAFYLKNSVGIYGGFIGNETTRAQRNYTTNTTILSGDVDAGGNADCYHVVVGYNVNNTAVLDGFTITKGYADVAGSLALSGSDIIRREDGAGIINRNASPTIANCTITANLATDEGGAMYNYASSPIISNCTFSSNIAKYGGAMNNYLASAPSIGNSSFSSNATSAGGYGGAIRNDGSSPILTACSFTSNSTATDGGAVYNENASSSSFTGCSFTSNTSPSEGGAIYNKNSSPSFVSCNFSSNTATTSGGDGGAMFNNNSPASINNSIFTGNTAGNDGGAIRSSGSSITVTGCTFTLNSAGYGGAMQHNGSATITIANCTFTSNTAITRAGAIYNNGSTPTLTNCTFTSNHCNDDGGALYNSNSTIVTATQCVFSTNTSDDTGGAVANQSSSTNTYINCLFSGNTSDVGGGIYNNSITTTITNCTVYNNTAYGIISSPNGGGGIRNSGGVLTIRNCIIWANTSPVGASIYSTATTTVSYSTVQGSYTGAGNISVDPIFVNPSNVKGADNIWATADDGLMIHCTSPAKNTGTPTGAPATDIVGSARPNGTGYDMGAYEQIATPTVPAVNIAITTGAQNICAGTAVEFTATPTNCGSSPVYQWQVNGSNVGTNSATYTNTGLVNGDVVKCIVTPSLDVCSSTATATSNTVTITVTTPASASFTYATPYCSNGGTANVSLTGTTGGTFSSTTGLVINASTGGINLSSSTAGTYTVTYSIAANACPAFSTTAPITITTAPSANISYVGSPYCSSVGTANVSLTGTTGGTFSSTIGLVINASTGAINLSSSTAGAYNVAYTIPAANGCAIYTTTNAITITAMPTASISYAGTPYCSNAGTATVSLTGTTGGTFSSTTGLIINASTGAINLSSSTAGTYTVTYTVAAAGGCALYSTNTSITITAAPSASISYAGSPYCSNVGTAAVSLTGITGGTFSSTTGLAINASTGSINLSSSTAGTYVVTYAIAAAGGCPLYSTTASITTTAAQVPTNSIVITSGIQSICAGTSLTFTASPTNGGISPIYQWQVNGISAGTNSNQFTSTTLNNNDIVSCMLTSSASCVTTSNATSNSIAITVSPNLTPSVSIAPSSNNICAGNSVTFIASPLNGGSAPIFQWQVNGINTGSNNASYTTGTLANGDIVTCKITSNATCVTTAFATSNNVTMTVNPILIPSISITASNTVICTGMAVQFTATIANGGSAPIYQWYLNGTTLTGNNSPNYGILNLTGPYTIDCVLTNNSACATPATVTSNVITITINPIVTPIVTIAASTNNICLGTSVTFTASPANEGTSPIYQWKVNGINAGTNSPSFTSSTLTNNDLVQCVLTSNAICLTTPTAVSNNIAMIVNANVTPAISIGSSANNTCVGTNITFTATATNGGSLPAYQWKVNGLNAGTNSNTFSTNTLANGDIVTCSLTSNAACLTTGTVTSNSITMSISTGPTPTIAIFPDINPSICPGTNINFFTLVTNEGSSPAYQWQVNNINVGTNSPIFNSATFSNNDVVKCILTSSVSCPSVTTVASNPIMVTLNPIVAPVVSIVASVNNICAGTKPMFTCTVTNGGPVTPPTYQWQINGFTILSSNMPTIFITPNNNDVITCVLLNNNPNCYATPTVSSNAINMIVNPKVTPAISVVSSASNICAGTNVIFSATPMNGGPSPIYQWKVNGINVGTNAPTYSSTGLNNNDLVSCEITSNTACLTNATATSNSIAMTVNANIVPTINIVASTNSICLGANISFTAAFANGGTAPVYQWKVNGVNVGTNASTYSSSTLNNNDIVTCEGTSNAACLATSTATSNAITILASGPVTPTVTIVAANNTICSGTVATFTATVTNGGTLPFFQWKINGTNAGINASIFSSTTLNNNDIISCMLTSNVCTTTPTVASNNITIGITPSVTPTIAIASSIATICEGADVTFTASSTNGGTAPVYQWAINGTNTGTNSNSFTTNALAPNDVVTCSLTSSNTCVTVATVISNTSVVKVNLLPQVFAGPNKTIFTGAFTQLYATVTGNIDSIKWSPSASLNYDTILQPIANPLISTLYRLRVVSLEGCAATDEVEVKVVEKVVVPNAFSPNGDNINDKWEIPDLTDFAESFVQVFNRSGQLVFKATGYTSTKYWDGTKNGSPLPVGVYYYIIDLKNGDKPMSGYVTILK